MGDSAASLSSSGSQSAKGDGFADDEGRRSAVAHTIGFKSAVRIFPLRDECCLMAILIYNLDAWIRRPQASTDCSSELFSAMVTMIEGPETPHNDIGQQTDLTGCGTMDFSNSTRANHARPVCLAKITVKDVLPNAKPANR